MISLPYILLVSAAVSVLAGAASFHMGHKMAAADCSAEKNAAVLDNLDLKVKNDEIRNNRPAGAAVIGKLRRGEF